MADQPDSHMGTLTILDLNPNRVVIMDEEDFNEIVKCARELQNTWNISLGETFEKRRYIGQKILSKARGVILNERDLKWESKV